MKKRKASVCVLGACAVLAGAVSHGTQAAAPAPYLSATTLYTATAHNCQPVDLATWRHPAQTILQAAHAHITKVELCNDGRFPVFTATLPYALDGPNDAWFNRLFAELADANGFWSYALVDLSNDVVITATVQRSSHAVTLSYEDIRAPGAPGTALPGSPATSPPHTPSGTAPAAATPAPPRPNRTG